ncbi:hypothetical protein [Endozoicomonas sp. GU-1]|uniref:hypothetical protein n=1 Tax=Endozoicomonas sp. GU-1 TaxID=3009078 RepID=UPI0022B2BF05|nr:hypothetical protein [Endozoicomonas sp. GU-1]WBA83612.1 hypothetical protein O2T12_11050 [Endozoicomonas sp. GU-1]WBA86590.1 hypothetical protein O3276_00615 [Endozoicomonas sp. GU-1]
MPNAPTAQTITRYVTDPITDPAVNRRNCSVFGTTAGLGAGSYLGSTITNWNVKDCMYCLQYGNVTDCDKCVAATGFCSLTTVGITIVTGLAFGGAGYLCAKQIQKSSCLANNDSEEDNLPPDQDDTPARDITGTTDQETTQPVTTAPVTATGMIDKKSLPNNAGCASSGSMDPLNVPPSYKDLFPDPPNYEEAMKLLRDSARE